MMSQIQAPIHSYENPRIYYQYPKKWQKKLGSHGQKKLKHFSTTNRASCDDLELNPVPTYFNNLNNLNNRFFQSPEKNIFCLFDCLFVCLEKLAVQPNSENLAVQPNPEKSGSPNPPTNKKYFLSSFKYDLLNKHVKCSDQQMGAVHPVLSGAHPYLSGAHPYFSGTHPYLSGGDFKIMKVCTIIF